MSACFSPSWSVIQEHCRLCWGFCKGKLSKQSFLPFWGVSFPFLWDKTELLLFIPACICLPSFLHPSLSDFPPSAFAVLELFQEQTVDGKDSYFLENQRMGCTITQYKPGCVKQLCLGGAGGCILTNSNSLVPGSFPELDPPSPWAAGQHCHGWAVEAVPAMAASELSVLHPWVLDVMRSDCAGCRVAGLAVPIWRLK